MKTCSKCKTSYEKPELYFYRSSKTTSGFAVWCKACERAKNKAKRKTPERFVSETHRECTRCSTVKPNSDFPKCSRLKSGYGIYCKSCQNECNRASHSLYKDTTNRKRAEKVSACPKSTMNYRILGLVRKAIARKDIPVRPMSVTKGFWSTVGYDKLQLCAHLEAQFLPGMGWHNMREWHIDHIKPVRLFDFKSFDCPEFAECWGLPNLRPLWARDNLVKGGRYTPTEDA